MSRKDYMLIASALRESVERSDRQSFDSVYRQVLIIADALNVYPSFDRGRFLSACGV